MLKGEIEANLLETLLKSRPVFVPTFVLLLCTTRYLSLSLRLLIASTSLFPMYHLLLFLMSLFSFFSCSASQSTTAQSLSASAFAKLIEADSSIVRLDVRTAEEHAQGHIAGSVNIDVMQPTFEQQVQAQLPKEKTIALYCRSGQRSKQALRLLNQMGYKVVELSTGILGWQSEGLPTQR